MAHLRLPTRIVVLVVCIVGLFWLARDSSTASFRIPESVQNAYDRFHAKGAENTALPDAGDREVYIDGAGAPTPNPTTAQTGPAPLPTTLAPSTISALYPTTPPRIQLVAVWNARENVPLYLPNFFASVVSNPSLDLLFVRYDAYEEGLCPQATRLVPDAPNTRELCLTFDEFWGAHADFVCARWGCTPKERAETLALIKQRKFSDPTNSAWKPFRAAVFHKYIHPDTELWGYCDQDTMFGNVDRMFPWDEQKNFDVFVPSPHADFQTTLLFIAGHLAIFRRTPVVVDALMEHPFLRSFAAFTAGPWFGDICDEAEWSHFILVSPRLTWLAFPALIDERVRLHATQTGVFELRSVWWWDGEDARTLLPSTPAGRAVLQHTLTAYADGADAVPRHATFSASGSEYVVDLKPGKGAYPGDLWFDPKYALHADMDEHKYREDLGFGKRFFLRRMPGGPVVDRQEPAQPIKISPPAPPDANELPYALEGLYSHFQGEKYADWWDMPKSALIPGHMLLTDRDRGAEVWDANGNVVFSALLPPGKEAHQ